MANQTVAPEVNVVSPGEPVASRTIRREGKWLIVPAGAKLPERCVICNAPAVPPLIALSRSSPAWLLGAYAVLAAAFLVTLQIAGDPSVPYAITALFIGTAIALVAVPRIAMVTVGGCVAHRKLPISGEAVGAMFMVGSSIALFGLLRTGNDGYLWIGAVFFAFLMIATYWHQKSVDRVRSRTASDGSMTIYGTGAPFLESFPEK